MAIGWPLGSQLDWHQNLYNILEDEKSNYHETMEFREHVSPMGVQFDTDGGVGDCSYHHRDVLTINGGAIVATHMHERTCKLLALVNYEEGHL